MSSEVLGARTIATFRVALGIFFVLAGFAKLGAPDETIRIMTERGVPAAAPLALAIGVGESLAGAMLLAGLRQGAVAAALMLYLIPVIVIFHNPLGLAPGAAHVNAIAFTMDMIVFLGLAIVLRGRSPRSAFARSRSRTPAA